MLAKANRAVRVAGMLMFAMLLPLAGEAQTRNSQESSSPDTPSQRFGRNGYLSLAIGPAMQWFSPAGYIWTDESFAEPIAFPGGQVTHGTFTFSGGGMLNNRWGLLFDVDGHVPHTVKAGHVLVGLSAMRVVTSRFRWQGGIGLGGLVPSIDATKAKTDGKSDSMWLGGVGVYGAAIYDVAKLGDLWLNVHVRASAAQYEEVGVTTLSLQLGISR